MSAKPAISSRAKKGISYRAFYARVPPETIRKDRGREQAKPRELIEGATTRATGPPVPQRLTAADGARRYCLKVVVTLKCLLMKRNLPVPVMAISFTTHGPGSVS